LRSSFFHVCCYVLNLTEKQASWCLRFSYVTNVYRPLTVPTYCMRSGL
jgi:hypothetical protein